ncbi:MAG: metal-dependent transcriptional regulator [Chloroflexota bacterium]|nr:metal-dependent transcriptional regulator [Chloroflexota bacterium]
MASAVAEEYLETIYNMTMEGEPVIGARLAEKFRVSRPTVSETVKRLLADGYIEQAPDKSISLTPVGKELTEGVLRRHRLAERLLFDVLGMDWISAHEQAHALEHWISGEVEQRISTLLNHPSTCPHGNPIPGNASGGEAFLREQHAFRLAGAKKGQEVRVILISELVEDESDTLRRLNDKHVHPQATLTLLENDPSSAVVFEARGEAHSIPQDLATKIWVADGARQAPGRGE